MTSKAFRERLDRRARNAGVVVAPDVAEQLEAYLRLLARWNTKINLTSVPTEDPTDETFDRLLIEPLAAAGHVDDSWGPWFDIGSGGGSPALPIKLVKPSLRLTMVESKARKAAFLREAVRALGLADVAVENTRIEDFATAPDLTARVGLITLRAVRIDRPLVHALARLLLNDGRLLLFRTLPGDANFAGFVRESAQQLVSSPERPAHLVIYRRFVPRGTLTIDV